MADNIVVTYKENLDEFTSKLKTARDQNVALGKSVSDVGDKAKSAGDKASSAFKSTGDEAGRLENRIRIFAERLTAAFSVTAIIAFGKASVNAFIESEKKAQLLKTAVSSSGGLSSDFEQLIKQTKELQKTTIFSDEQIAGAQTLALQAGLVSSQVKKLLPVIADFASATGQDLNEALSAVLRGTEGNARQLRLYGIEVSSTGDKADKLSQITQQLNDRFKGQAAQLALLTTGGQLKQLANAFDDIKESIGGAIVSLGNFVINNFIDPIGGQARETLKKFAEDKDKELKAAEIRQKQFGDTIKNLSLEQLQSRLEAESKLQKQFAGQGNKSDSQSELEKIRVINQRIIEETRLLEQNLSKLSLDEVKKLADGGSEAAEQELKKRIEAINKAREARQKEVKEEQDAQEQLKKFTFDELNKNAENKAENRKLIASQTISDADKLKEAELAIDEDLTKQKIKNAQDTLQPTEDLEKQLTEIHVKQNEQKKKSDEDASKTARKLIEEDVKDAIKNEDIRLEAEKRAAEERKKIITEIFHLSETLLNDLQGLANAQTQNQIDSINAVKDGELSAIDEQLAALDEAHNKRRIGDKKYEESKKKLLEQRKADEKKAADETKKLKQQEAERDKLFTVFSIILNTARAIVEALPNVFLSTLAGIVGAAELAIAVATPIPAFAKGTKGKHKSGMGIIGEQGAELVYMPGGTQVVPADRTRKYKEAINSMIDNNFEQYVYKAMIAPALREATRKMEKDRQKGFAENIANYFKVNNETNPYRVYDGVRMNNTELANAIGKVISKNINQGYQNPRYH